MNAFSTLPGGNGAKRFSVMLRNEALQSGQYRGQFDTLEEAQAYCAREVTRLRSFVTLQPVNNWEGRLLCGSQVRGET